MPRDKIKLISTADTGTFYTTTKNKKTKPDKMKMKKYDPKAPNGKGGFGAHVEFVETKI